MSEKWGMADGAIQKLDTLAIPVTSEGFQYGVGVFTTLRVHQGRAVWLGDHARRLQQDAAAVGLQYLDETTLAQRCAEVIRRNDLTEDGLKVIVYQDGSLAREVIVPRFHPYSKETPPRSLCLERCHSRRTSAAGRTKSLGYLEHALALRRAKAAGFDEALWIDADGCILETTTANFFLVRRGKVYTAPGHDGILPGIVRGHVLQWLGSTAECSQSLPMAWLEEAEEAFVTNALAGVLPVGRVGSRMFRAGPIALELASRVQTAWAGE